MSFHRHQLPNVRVVGDLTRARISSTKRTAGCELPEAFALSTIAAADLALSRSDKRTARRAVDKVERIAGSK